MTDNSLRSSLSRARGLGSAKTGAEQWWLHRVAALALIPLTLWFVFSVFHLLGAPLAVVQDWIASPTVAAALVLLVAVGFHHAAHGLQTVLEDYVHHELTRLGTVLAVKFILYALAVASIVAVLKISFGG
ncbi:MAG: succinate dehydrogenase, hydrophobic membrane anchor protein [Azospirillaceae bacterium]|nr:succinate dehydrogenase, hydrophobic membrane anchor protein [Azospirillaceae bacterium]